MSPSQPKGKASIEFPTFQNARAIQHSPWPHGGSHGGWPLIPRIPHALLLKPPQLSGRACRE